MKQEGAEINVQNKWLPSHLYPTCVHHFKILYCAFNSICLGVKVIYGFCLGSLHLTGQINLPHDNLKI